MIDREKVIKELESLRDICNAKSNMAVGKGKVAWAGYANAADDAIALLKEQEDTIRIISADYEDLQKEHERLLDKKIPLITNGQEVVRCKDCRHCDQDTMECNIKSGWFAVSPNWFCADGERRLSGNENP